MREEDGPGEVVRDSQQQESLAQGQVHKAYGGPSEERKMEHELLLGRPQEVEMAWLFLSCSKMCQGLSLVKLLWKTEGKKTCKLPAAQECGHGANHIWELERGHQKPSF